MREFFFSRLSISTNKYFADYLQKSEYLFNALASNSEIIYRKDNFKFINAIVLQENGKTYLSGELVKYKPSAQENVLTQDNKIESVELQNKVLTSLRFFIDPASSIIFFEENRGYIPKESFGDRFAEVVMNHYKDDDAAVTVQAITDAHEFATRVKEVTTIKKISITLVPSNPNNSDLWEDVDNRLRNNKISFYKEIQVNKKKDESIEVDDETKAKFQMSEDGYGKSDVVGKDINGERITVSTADVATHSKEAISQEIASLGEMIQAMQDKLQELIKRTKEAEK